ncbi:MAG: phosphoribosylanthranilate isomerase [Alphaproteobacteria bacterium]|nr:phosphoribosylanthranilate isomerase [Alphaproteobacteria bacterium]
MAQVKICGIATEAALAHAISAGADFVGLVHFAKSPRHVRLEEAADFVARARALGNAKTVVLLIDPGDELVAAVADAVAPDIIQLHGHETPKRVAAIRKIANRTIWKAVPVATADDVAAAEAYLLPGVADLILFDAKPPAGASRPGGNALHFDWTILAGVAQRHRFALAGGLTPSNVAAAVATTKAAIVDVSSGVETAPGRKDPALVERFIAAARQVGQSAEK